MYDTTFVICNSILITCCIIIGYLFGSKSEYNLAKIKKERDDGLNKEVNAKLAKKFFNDGYVKATEDMMEYDKKYFSDKEFKDREEIYKKMSLKDLN